MFRFHYCGRRQCADDRAAAGGEQSSKPSRSRADRRGLPAAVGALARASLFVGPFSWLIRSLGAVPVERGSATAGIRALLGMLKAGEAMIVFPEGTRTDDGDVQPLQPGFCAIARRSGAAIVPTTIDGAFAALPRGENSRGCDRSP